ncbi:MAG: hypothetical protein HYV07_17410 [Deltaproteobacteria bacterium]|nr:hypothetical protein [Deltaproteobacteria bacterium]
MANNAIADPLAATLPLTLESTRLNTPHMLEDVDPLIAELRLLREQQWSMHNALVGKIGETSSRLEGLIGETSSRLEGLIEETNSRLEETNSRLERVETRLERVETSLDALGRYTVDGFKQVVERANALESAFVRFVELVREDRHEVRASMARLEARIESLEHEARRPRRKRPPAGAPPDS